MKNFNIFGVHGKIRVLDRGFKKNQYIGGRGLPKKGVLDSCRFKGGGLGKKDRVLFLRGRGGLIPQCTLCCITFYSLFLEFTLGSFLFLVLNINPGNLTFFLNKPTPVHYLLIDKTKF